MKISLYFPLLKPFISRLLKSSFPFNSASSFKICLAKIPERLKIALIHWLVEAQTSKFITEETNSNWKFVEVVLHDKSLIRELRSETISNLYILIFFMDEQCKQG